MANFRLQISSVSRAAGRTAIAAAAYRAGERIRDERSGVLHNYSRREDVLHKEIVLPSELAGTARDGADLDWARDRAKLWNIAEQAETRRTARVAREIQVTLPAELAAAQRLELARRFSQEVADRYHIAVDLAIHEPRPGSDPRNFHAHLLGTTREIRRDGLGAKTGLDLPRGERQRRGLPTHSEEFTNLRERWAALTNEALREAHIDARVDHRSLQAQGIDREPVPRIPFAAYQIEKKGETSDVAERMRAQFRLRMQTRLERTALSQQTGLGAPRLAGPSQDPPRPHGSTESAAQKSLDEVRRQSREAWLKMRAAAGELPALPAAGAVREPAAARASKEAAASPERERAARGSDDEHSI